MDDHRRWMQTPRKVKDLDLSAWCIAVVSLAFVGIRGSDATVENIERMVSSHLRRWFGVPRSISSAALYSTSAKLQLPFKGLIEDFKVGTVRHLMMLRNCQDEIVRRARVELRTGRNGRWKLLSRMHKGERKVENWIHSGKSCNRQTGIRDHLQWHIWHT